MRMLAWAASALLAAAALVAPWALGPYPLYIVCLWMVMSLSAVGLNIPMGLASVHSFGQGAFMLVGAYSVGVSAIHLDSTAVGLVAAVLFSAVVGFLIALPSLRLTGFALALVTFSFASLMFGVVKSFEITGGPQGLVVPDVYLSSSVHPFALYYVILALLVAGVFVFRSIQRSKTGRALRTLGENELVARCLGIDVRRYKIGAFMLSAIYGALSGGLMALLTTYIAPESFGPELSIDMFAAVAIGGKGTLIGPLVGALFIVLIPELTQSIQNLAQVVYALLLCAAVTLYPMGLVGVVQAMIDKRRNRRKAAEALVVSGAST
jgi:branched-chain amino acid transport system permease protein